MKLYQKGSPWDRTNQKGRGIMLTAFTFWFMALAIWLPLLFLDPALFLAAAPGCLIGMGSFWLLYARFDPQCHEKPDGGV